MRCPACPGNQPFSFGGAEFILEGALPFQGMTTRTGPLFDYLLAVPLAIFGPSVWILRIMGVLPNLVALVFLYRAGLRRSRQSLGPGSLFFIGRAAQPGHIRPACRWKTQPWACFLCVWGWTF